MPTAPAWSLAQRFKNHQDPLGPYGRPSTYGGAGRRGSKGGKMGKGGRDGLYGHGTPGPGQYHLPATLNGRSHTMSGRLYDPTDPANSKHRTPQFYTDTLPDSVRPTPPSFSFGRRSATMPELNQAMKRSPGPAAYDFVVRPSSAPSISFGARRDRRGNGRPTPGPGSYRIDGGQDSRFQGTKSVPRYSERRFQPSLREKEARYTPGPGSYDHSRFVGRDTRATRVRGKPTLPLYGITAGDTPHAYVPRRHRNGDYATLYERWGGGGN